MSATLETPVQANRAVRMQPYRFTIDKYHQLARAGVFGPEDHVELINGWIVSKMTLNPPHAIALAKLDRWFGRTLPEDYAVRCQLPITLGDDSEPEPDLVITAGRDDAYREFHPGAGQTLIVIEVADSSLQIDREDKFELYARHLLPEYWIVNLVDRQIEVYREPVATPQPTYRQRTIYLINDQVPVLIGSTPMGSLSAERILPELS